MSCAANASSIEPAVPDEANVNIRKMAATARLSVSFMVSDLRSDAGANISVAGMSSKTWIF